MTKEEIHMENLGQEISKHIMSAHKNILTIRSHLYNTNNNLERKLIENIVRSLTVTLQNITFCFRSEQNNYLRQINSMEQYTNEFFDSLTNFDAPSSISNAQVEYHNNMESETSVDTFDNFLKPTTSYNSSQIDDLQNDEKLDEYFQRRGPEKLNQRQLLQFELDNTKMIESREQEVKS
jgi:syntaxin 16